MANAVARSQNVSDQISGAALKAANVARALTCPLLTLDQAKQLTRAEGKICSKITLGITRIRAADAFWGLWPYCWCIDAMSIKEGYGGGHIAEGLARRRQWLRDRREFQPPLRAEELANGQADHRSESLSQMRLPRRITDHVMH